jgi:hypothetical protein
MPMTLGKPVGNSILITVMLGNDEAVAQPTFTLFDMRYLRSKTPGATYFFTVVTCAVDAKYFANRKTGLLRAAFHMMNLPTSKPVTPPLEKLRLAESLLADLDIPNPEIDAIWRDEAQKKMAGLLPSWRFKNSML